MTRTIALSGTEVKLDGLGGTYANVMNSGVDVVYASASPDIVAGADGVIPIAAGSSVIIECNGTVYLLGTGNVTAVGSSEPISFFKAAAAGGSSGGTIDEQARTAINTHAGNADIHLTAEGAIEAAATTISNPNLLINPGFKINQRGQTVYNGIGTKQYIVDGWHMDNGTVTVDGDGVVLEAPDATTLASLRQSFENFADFGGKTVTVSLDCDILTEGCRLFLQFKRNGAWSEQGTAFTGVGRQVISRTVVMPDEITDQLEFAIMLHTPTSDVASKAKLYSVKIEIGSVATPFIPPDPATELAKCQRYLQVLPYGHYRTVGSANTPELAFVNLPLAVAMRTTPTLTVNGETPLFVGTHEGNSFADVALSNVYTAGGNLLLTLSGSFTTYQPVVAYHQSADKYPLVISAEL